MDVRCPHCQSPVDLAGDSSWSDITCPSCGSSFSLLGDDETATYDDAGRRKLGHFELIEPIGSGSFGSVWRARDTELHRTVAVKIPRKGQLSPSEVDLFLREARQQPRSAIPISSACTKWDVRTRPSTSSVSTSTE